MLPERRIRPKIEQSLKKYPVVSIVGSRQTGKTTLAKQIMAGLKVNKARNFFLTMIDNRCYVTPVWRESGYAAQMQLYQARDYRCRF